MVLSHQFDLEPEFLELHELCRGETMTSLERMYALWSATRYIVDNDLPGDFVECGVWRGGSVMLMALTLLRRGDTNRDLWLYDTFRGMTEPTDDDVQAMSGRAALDILRDQARTPEDPFWGIASRDAVEENLRRTAYPFERFRFVEGDVMATLPETAPSRIALLPPRHGLVHVDSPRARKPLSTPRPRRCADHRRLRVLARRAKSDRRISGHAATAPISPSDRLHRSDLHQTLVLPIQSPFAPNLRLPNQRLTWPSEAIPCSAA